MNNVAQLRTSGTTYYTALLGSIADRDAAVGLNDVAQPCTSGTLLLSSIRLL